METKEFSGERIIARGGVTGIADLCDCRDMGKRKIMETKDI